MTPEILFEHETNPTPPGGVADYFTTRDGKKIRYARFMADAHTLRGPVKGTVLLLSGRNEYIEKYFETIGELLQRGFNVAMTDWRGQGRSDRLLKDPARGYVRDFSDYVDDFTQFFDEIVQPSCHGPYYLLAHSTGGLIALMAAPSLVTRVRRMVLIAPLLQLYRLPASVRTVQRVTGFMRAIGLGWIYASGGPRKEVPFATNVLTTDQGRYKRNNGLIDAFPALSMGGPTVSWVNRVCHAAEMVRHPDFMARIQIPILFVAAGADEVVSTQAIEAYARGLRSGAVVTIDGARHEILQERDLYREQFLAAFDAFIPGSDPVYGAERQSAAPQDSVSR